MVSVVMPSLNQGAFIEAAICSLLAQEYPRLEIIVIDGGSSDGTLDVLRRYAHRITHWRTRADDGPAQALGDGFRSATGDILGILNADDVLLPQALTTIVREFEAHPDADVVAGHGFFAAPSGQLGPPMFSDPWDAKRFAHGACVLVQPSTFFRRRALERADGLGLVAGLCWDFELWGRMAATGAVVRIVDAHLSAARLHGDSITGRSDLVGRRRADSRAVFQRLTGRRAGMDYRLRAIAYRLAKAVRHPARTVRQRLFVFRILGRWRL